MTSLGGLYPWAQASLGNQTFINDFSIPLAYLVTAIASLLKQTKKYQPLRTLPKYLGEQHGQPIPWGGKTASGSNPLEDAPDTHVTRVYNFVITRGIIAPDGLNKSALLVNGQYPGPLIEANWGDTIKVNVRNQIYGPEEGTSLHWHGQPVQGSTWYDGVPGVSQCAIAPGETFTYEFKADLYGSSWYHSHYSAQYTGGLYGPMVIYGPSSANYDIDLGPVIVHDYLRQDYKTLLESTLGDDSLTALLTPSDNTLIHGVNYVCDISGTSGHDCAENPGLAKWRLQSGKVHRLRLINPSTAASPMLFSIDNHTMTVIANDYTPIVPYKTNVVSLAAGQRTDILVEGSHGSNGMFFIRTRLPALCNYSQQTFGLAAIYYEDANPDEVPLASLPHPEFLAPQLTVCKNDPLELTVPAYKMSVKEPDTVATIIMDLVVDSKGLTRYTLNGHAYVANFSDPLLGLAINPTSTYREDANLMNFGSNKTIRIILENKLSFGHPMHLHGHPMSILAEGVGKWNGTIANAKNPQRRDTQIVQGSGYAVIQFQTKNPGVWPLHCHIAWHLSAGMHVNILTRQDSLNRHKDEVKKHLQETCTAWNRWVAVNNRTS